MIGAQDNHVTIVGGSPVTAMQQMTGDATVQDLAYIIADDHPSVTLAVGQMLAEGVGLDPTCVTTFKTSTALLAACAAPAALPRLVVLDLVMPGDLQRAALVRALLEVDPEARVLVYTGEESAFLARAVMEAGAAGYVAKTSPPEEMMRAILAVCAGGQHIDQHIDLESTKAHQWASLTVCERGVLLDLCRGAKVQDIVDNTGRTYPTVQTHKYNGLRKLGLRDETDLLSYIYANGLLCELDVDPVTQ